MWIFCCGMQRSGSTLQFQITADVVEGAGLGQRVGWVPPDRFPALRREWAGVAGMKVVKIHRCTDEMAAEFARGNARGIYVFRDFRDVVGSVCRQYGVTVADLWGTGFFEECLTAHDRWTQLPEVLVSRYEEVVRDLPAEVHRIAGHLGVSLDERRCREIAEAYGATRQRERILEAQRGGRLRLGSGGSWFDPHSQLHVGHLGDGATGDWRMRLTRTEVALVESVAGPWLAARGYLLALGPLERGWRVRAHRLVRRLGRAWETGSARRRPGSSGDGRA